MEKISIEEVSEQEFDMWLSVDLDEVVKELQRVVLFLRASDHTESPWLCFCDPCCEARGI